MEQWSQIWRKIALVIVFVLAIGVLTSAIALLLSMLTLACIALIFSYITAPGEPKAFFTKARHLAREWIDAMVKMVSDSGELVKEFLKKRKPESNADKDKSEPS